MLCLIWEKCKGVATCLWHGICGNGRDIENRMRDLEEQIQKLKEHCHQKQDDPHHPTVIEQLYVEKILVDKIEYNNNFGSLGIKELSGMLNIGANYGLGTMLRNNKKPEQGSRLPETKDKKQKKPDSGPKCNIIYK